MANVIDAALLAKMFLAGAQNLDANKEYINELNVFPVPDGDTGTNMTLTIMSAAKDVQALENVVMADLCKAISQGSLRGARGNSGVILSQLLRGLTKSVRDLEEIDVPTLAAAMTKAAETAYKAVMKPKEGTILTVAKGMAEKGAELAATDIEMKDFLEQVIAYGDQVLDQTPEMLPVLKQAGVVDSGGMGLMTVVKGALDMFNGKEIQITIGAPKAEEKPEVELKYLYSQGFTVVPEKPLTDDSVAEIRLFLENIGENVVCDRVGDDLKVCIDTNRPGKVLSRGLIYGQVKDVYLYNLRLEAEKATVKEAAPEEVKAEPVELKEYGFVAVCAGDGLKEIFESLGVDYVISGGQTMNPSTDDFLNAVEKVNAKTVFALPNNKNIILAAEQAAKLSKDKKIIVIPTKTVPQGITAAINFNPEGTAEENEAAMKEESSRVKTGEVTYATRNTCIDGKTIKTDDIMGIGDSAILSVGQSINETTLDMLSQMTDDETSLISIYYGADITEADAQVLADQVSAKYSSCDVDMHKGGQPVYYYIVSAE